MNPFSPSFIISVDNILHRKVFYKQEELIFVCNFFRYVTTAFQIPVFSFFVENLQDALDFLKKGMYLTLEPRR